MARKKLKNAGPRTGDGDIKPPPQVYSNAVWAYRAEDQSWYLMDPPTREELIKHAERFGVDQIAETAVECGYGLEELIALIERLDMIDATRKVKDGKRFSSGGKRSTAEKRAKKLLNWVAPEADDDAEEAA